MELTTTAVAEPVVATILEAILPFQADDNHKGTFIVLRVAGLGQGTALKLIKRKYRSWQNWRSTDEDFRRLDDAVPVLTQRFGGEARVIRTAMLDISIVEAGIGIFKRVFEQRPVRDVEWGYVTKLAGLRMPMMGAQQGSASPWERLANSIQNTLAYRELTVAKELDGSQSITAKETIVEIVPSPEQRRVTAELVNNILNRVGAESGE